MYKTQKDVTDVTSSTTFVNQHTVMSIQNREHRNELIRKSGILCIKVWAEWCRPCLAIKSEYAGLTQEYPSCTFVEEDYENGIRSDVEGITSLPTFLLYVRGKLAGSIVGSDLNELRKALNELIEKVNNLGSRPIAQSVSNPLKGSTMPAYRSNYGAGN
jgi:thiol-disulfide isomerase/thioredoxin